MPLGIALIGGEEFRSGCEELDRAILASVESERPRLLVLPTAAAHENPAMAASNGVRYFSELGADAAPLMVLDRSDAEDQALAAEVESADVVYLTGGDPAHLLDTLLGVAAAAQHDGCPRARGGARRVQRGRHGHGGLDALPWLAGGAGHRRKHRHAATP